MESARLVLHLGHCLATNMVVKEGQKVRFMYRETPDNGDDSGWRFFSGDESDEYANNPNNINICDINTITEIDVSIIPYLDRPIGSAFEREDTEGAFVEVKDFILSKLN